MTTKKDRVKNYVRNYLSDRVISVNYVLRTLTGTWAGARWHEQILDVSLSTVRRSLDELVTSGEYESYYPIGHCFDEKLYKKVSDG